MLTAPPGCPILRAAADRSLSSLPIYAASVCLHPQAGNVQDASGKVGTAQANPRTHSLSSEATEGG